VKVTSGDPGGTLEIHPGKRLEFCQIGKESDAKSSSRCSRRTYSVWRQWTILDDSDPLACMIG